MNFKRILALAVFAASVLSAAAAFELNAGAAALTEYTVRFVFDDNSSRADETAYDDADAVNALPANPYLPNYVIPRIPGYVFVDYSLSGTTYTLNYAKHIDTIGTWFTRNNVCDKDMLISDMNFIGAHDAFTAKMVQTPDVAAALGGDDGAKWLLNMSGIMDIKYAQTQSETPAVLLRNGVRYFDLRLSVSDSKERYNLINRTGTNGELYTTHGYLCQPFKTTLYQIRDICAENPGEVIILDFQEIYNTLGSLSGGHDNSSWDMTAELLRKIIGEYLVQGHSYGANGAESLKWGDITNGGERAAVICIGKPGSQNTQSDLFYRGGDRTGDAAASDNADDDKYSNIYSYWTTSMGTYDEMITDIADNQMKYIPSDRKRFTVMQAIYGKFGSNANLCESGTYVSDHIAENAEFENTWIKQLKIFMTDAAHVNSGTHINMFAEYNRDTYDKTYNQSSNGVTVTTAAGAGANVPLSSRLEADAQSISGEFTADNTAYTKAVKYTVSLMQYNMTGVQPTGEVTITFPKESTDSTTLDAVFAADDLSAPLATAAAGEAVSISVNALNAGGYIVAKAAAPSVNMTVEYYIGDVKVKTDGPRAFAIGSEAYSIPASEAFYFEHDTGAGIVKNTAEQSYVVSADDENAVKRVAFENVHEYAAVADTFADISGSADCNNTSDLIFLGANAYAQAALTDADDASTTDRGSVTVGNPRIGLISFKVPNLTGKEAVRLNAYAAYVNENLDSNNYMKLAAIPAGGDFKADESAGYKAENYAYDNQRAVWSYEKNVGTAQTSGGQRACGAWACFDVTDAVKAAAEAGQSHITFALYAPSAGAYIADREKAVLGGAFEGKAAYLDVDATPGAHTVTVSGAARVTKNGSNIALADGTAAVSVPSDSSVRITPADNIIVFLDGEGKAYEGIAAIDGGFLTADVLLTGYSLGVSLVQGAQVRIGAGAVDYNSRGYKINTEVTSLDPALASSGLRFIAVIDGGGLAGSREALGAEVGIEVSPKDSPGNAVRIKADKFQNTERSVFSAALVNLSEGNYNRIFTAKPYVCLGGRYYYGEEVSRSIYEIAAGILADITVPVDGSDRVAVDVTEGVCRVLNAYVNQVGIRLSFANGEFSARTAGSGKYESAKNEVPQVFFTIDSYAADRDGAYTVEITAGGSAEIFGYWDEYIRLNNRKLSDYIVTDKTTLSNDGKTLTLEISTAKQTTAAAEW